MTFGTGDWKQLILEAVGCIADEAYQRRAWFGNTQESLPRHKREVSSPGEEINRLFSDLDFEDFLNSPKGELTADQRRLGLALRDTMRVFIDGTPQFLDPVQVVDDPRWADIRLAAAEFARVLRAAK